MSQTQPPSSDTYLFRVSNHHVPGCGSPPQIDGDAKRKYHGYFENEHGEQAIFVYDYQTKTGKLWMGDVDWEESHDVIDGSVPELVLTVHEALWLRTCWYAALGVTPVSPADPPNEDQ